MSRGEDVRFVTPAEYYNEIRAIATAAPKNRRERGFPEWVVDALDTYMATACRVSEAVGTRGRQGLDEEESAYLKPQSRVKPHHGIRARDVLPNHRVYVGGKNTTPKGRTEDLKPGVVLCAHEDTYRMLQRRAERTMENYGPDYNIFLPEASVHLADAGDGKEMLRTEIRKLQRHLPAKWRSFSGKWLRHSHAIAAIRAGVDLVSIQRQLRHASLATTAIYLRYAGIDEKKYLSAFHVGASVEKRDCPSCGFAWEVNAQTGALSIDSRMGVALRRRVVA